MTRVTPLDKLRVPLGGQEIELQEIDYEVDGDEPVAEPPRDGSPLAGSAPGDRAPTLRLLRTRIREKSRFTVFDIDPQTAEQWGLALLRWAQSQGRS
jgi:hypothetical protein